MNVDWTLIGNQVLVGVLVPVSLGILGMIWISAKNLMKLNQIMARLDCRGQENRLLFKWVHVLAEAIKSGECNGTLKAIEEETDEYLRESGIH